MGFFLLFWLWGSKELYEALASHEDYGLVVYVILLMKSCQKNMNIKSFMEYLATKINFSSCPFLKVQR